jgi:dipeptidyl aminopeptidase/acylaminoacyl peptidase
MTKSLRTLYSPLLILLLAAPLAAQKRPITPGDLWSLARVSSPALSPDGRIVAYTLTRYDTVANRGRSEIWVVPAAGGEPRAFVTSDGSNSQPVWSPDGRSLAFVSTRGGKGAQAYVMPAAGGEARAVTTLEGGASGPVWSRDGRRLLVASEVWPEGDPAAQRLRALEERGVEAKIYDDLNYRHWDSWEDGRRSHVFVVDVASGDARDLTPGPYDTPPIALEGSHDYDISPDGAELVFVRNATVPQMVGTGNDIFIVPTSGGTPRRIGTNEANENSPAYSPDGRFIAFLSMQRPGFESDRTRIVVYDRASGQQRVVTETLDRSVDAFTWSGDSRTIYFTAQDELHHSVYRVPVAGGRVVQLTRGAFDTDVRVARDGRTLIVARQSVAAPVDLYALDASGRPLRRLTRTNDALLGQLALQPAESFWFEGAGGTRVQGFIVRPPDFDPSRKYPVVYLVHGGPQGAWMDSWSYRWNPNMFAAPGYVAVLVNPRGSTGYGQQFTDEISGDWGGKVFEDLMKGVDAVLARYPFLDGDNMAAAGASYGGYMMNWFNAQTTRFKALINHDGVFNLRSMYGATEELWFPEWEFAGKPWDKPELYDRWSPDRLAAQFKTPMLVIHGGLDYRVPLEQGLGAFTALRRQGIRSRLLYLPDEGHWVLRPKNALVWWDTMYEWLADYLKPATTSTS